ncbi:MAG: Ig-like domain-containing protein, partial [Hydrococcus sp. RM1_1_31]|nr:Ig-like domain-containing protein [Hydrococcus sp. RM1_1_31]
PNANLATSAGYYLNIAPGVIQDTAGNAFAGIGNATTLNFTTATAPDTIVPTLTGSNPADNATNIATNSNIVLTFSEAIEAGSGQIILYDSNGNVVETFDVASGTGSADGTITIANDRLTINPGADLNAGTGYYINIANGAIQDVAGNDFAGINDATTLNFITSAADPTPPTLASRNPADNAVNIAPNNNLVLTFSEDIGAGTGQIALYNSNGTLVETFDVAKGTGSDGGTVMQAALYAFRTITITLNPGANLSPSTGYYLNIAPSAVQDLAGNGFAGIGDNTTLNFTTADAPDTTPPTLTSSNPADNATNVPVNNSLVLTFNEDIEAGVGTITLHRADGTIIETFDVATSNRLSFSGNISDRSECRFKSEYGILSRYRSRCRAGFGREWICRY